MKLLFVGNSFTARNDLPGLLTGVAAGRGKAVETRLVWAGGASLRAHWNAGRAAVEIRGGGYDAVVLQEQSTLPVKNPERMRENVRLFDGAVRSAGARTVLYMTWARADAPDSQKTIVNAYADLGRELGATVAPVGLAWQRFLSRYDSPDLFDRDGSHPTPAGSYLAACVLFGTLFRESPAGAGGDIAGLAENDLAALRRTAWQACRSTRTGAGS